MEIDELLRNIETAHRDAIQKRDDYGRQSDAAAYQDLDKARGLSAAAMSFAAIAETLGVILGKPTPD